MISFNEGRIKKIEYILDSAVIKYTLDQVIFFISRYLRCKGDCTFCSPLMDAYQGYKLKQTFISTPYSKSEVELTVTNDGYSKVIEYEPRYCFKPVCTTGYNLVVYNEVIRTSYFILIHVRILFKYESIYSIGQIRSHVNYANVIFQDHLDHLHLDLK